MNLPFSSSLEIESLSRLFGNMSECYKLFWFQSILSQVIQGRDEMTYEELVDEMIADAWYMVSEYHLNLGPADKLEAVVKHINEVTELKSSEEKTEILKYLRRCEDRDVISMKRVLIDNVPYRLQAPFLH